MEQSKQSHRLTGSSGNNRGIIKGKKIKDMHLGEVTSCRVTHQGVVRGEGERKMGVGVMVECMSEGVFDLRKEIQSSARRIIPNSAQIKRV